MKKHIPGYVVQSWFSEAYSSFQQNMVTTYLHLLFLVLVHTRRNTNGAVACTENGSKGHKSCYSRFTPPL